jgi:CHAP domain/Fibronectin type III domain
MFKSRRSRARVAGFAAALVAATGLTVISSPPAAADPPPGGMTGAQLTSAFVAYGDTSGRWSGGDSTASVLLPDGRVVWLFSDTMLGTVNADHTRPRTSPMINNSIVVQDGAALTTTVHGGTTTAPLALVRPTATDQYYWVGDATIEGGALKVLYNSYRRTGAGALSFELTGTALATFALPALTLTNVVTLPVGSTVAWGAAIIEDGAFTYVYGSEYVAADGMRFARLARVPAGGLSGAWEFWTGTGWSASSAASARLPLSGVGTSFGVQKVGSQYVLVTVDANITFSPQVVAYTAASPTGPFTGPIDLFTAPEPAARQGVIVYDARVHPQLAPSGKLLVSYNVNSLNVDDLYDDARIYRPRFVDVTWPPAQPNPATLPAAPTGLIAAADPTGTVNLSWIAPSGSGLTYTVYQRDVTVGQPHFSRVTQPITTSVSIGGFKTQHTYELRVTARNANGEGPPSAVRSLTVVIAPPPAPTGLTATAGTDGTVSLSWSSVPYAWRYDAFRRDVTAGQADFEPVNDPTPQDTSATVNGLMHAHEYEFVVTAGHGGGDSPRSTAVRATVAYALPPAPTALTATPNADGTIRLAWTGPAQNVYFLVQQRDVTAGETAFTQLPLPALCCAMNAGYLVHNHEYEFRVLASNQGGNSAPSNLVRATATYPATAPPGTLTAVAGSGEVALTWGPSPTTDAWYWVYQRDVTAGEATFTRLPLPITGCCTMTAGFLTNGHAYAFKVTAIGPAGESAASSNVVQATPQVPRPGQVTGLTATALADGGIRLTWTDPGPNLWFWVYQRDVTAGETGFTKLSLPVTTCCTFTARLLTHQHVYQFRVAATNAAGDGPASAVVQATAVYAPPPAPTNLSAIAAGDGHIDLDWTAPAPDLFHWIYIRDVTAGQTTFTRSVFPTTATSARWGPLVHGHRYEFKVSAENQGGEGTASAVVSVTSVGGLPQPPSNLTATAGDGRITLNWTASPTSNVYYWVEMRPAGGNWQQLQFPLSTCCGHTVSLLLNGTTYEFRLRANNLSGNSAPSNVASARPMPPFPQSPTNLTAAASGDTAARLTWTASPTGSVYYWIHYRYAGTTSWTRAQYPVTTCCTFTLSYLTPGRTYEFMLRAENLSGLSSPSNVATVTLTIPTPATPGNVRAVPSEFDSNVTVYWSPANLATSYAVEVRTCGSSGPWRTVRFMITNTQWTYPYAHGCHQYRVVADRYGKYGTPSNGTAFAYGTYDDYAWKGGTLPLLDPYLFRRKQCTSFVASRVDKYRNPSAAFNGVIYNHAKNWDNAAASNGGFVFQSPAVGAIAQWNGGSFGHVAWVAGIDGGWIIVEEYNFTNSEAYSRRKIGSSNPDNYLTVA